MLCPQTTHTIYIRPYRNIVYQCLLSVNLMSASELIGHYFLIQASFHAGMQDLICWFLECTYNSMYYGCIFSAFVLRRQWILIFDLQPTLTRLCLWFTRWNTSHVFTVIPLDRFTASVNHQRLWWHIKGSLTHVLIQQRSTLRYKAAPSDLTHVPLKCYCLLPS